MFDMNQLIAKLLGRSPTETDARTDPSVNTRHGDTEILRRITHYNIEEHQS